MKILNKLLFGGALSCASVLNAELFQFQENSSLSKDQQLTLKVLFVKSSVEGIKTLATSFGKGTLADIVKDYLKGSETLYDIILPYLLNNDHKSNDLKAILEYNTSDNNLANGEELYLEAIAGENDGLFNGVIRETLKTFKKFILSDATDDTAQLTEAFDVLWKTVSSNEVVLDLNEEFLSKISTLYPNLKISSLIESLNNTNGRNICEKIANLLASNLEEKIDDAVSAHCCGCFQTTFGIAKDITKTVIPYIPEILKLVITIITIVS